MQLLFPMVGVPPGVLHLAEGKAKTVACDRTRTHQNPLKDLAVSKTMESRLPVVSWIPVGGNDPNQALGTQLRSGFQSQERVSALCRYGPYPWNAELAGSPGLAA